VYEKEVEKIKNYQDLKREIGRLWRIRHLEVVLVVFGALRVLSKTLDALHEKLLRCYHQNGTVAENSLVRHR